MDQKGIYKQAILLSLCILCFCSCPCAAVEISVRAQPAVQVQSSSPVYPFAILSCNIQPANASITSRWITPHGRIVTRTADRYILNEGRTPIGLGAVLAIQTVSYKDAGMYTCEVVSRERGCGCNGFPVSSSVQLILQVHLESPMSEVIVKEGATTTLRCEMSGYIPPDEDLLWYKGQTIVYDGVDGRVSISFEEGAPNAAQNGGNGPVASRISLLTIASSVPFDTGNYTCRVKGSEVTTTINLSVESDRTGWTTTVGDAVEPTNITTTSKLPGTHGQPATTANTEAYSVPHTNEDPLNGQSLELVAIPMNGCKADESRTVAITFGITFTATALVTLMLTTTAFCLWLKLWQRRVNKGRTASLDHGSECRRDEMIVNVSVQTSDSDRMASSGSLDAK